MGRKQIRLIALSLSLSLSTREERGRSGRMRGVDDIVVFSNKLDPSLSLFLSFSVSVSLSLSSFFLSTSSSACLPALFAVILHWGVPAL